MGEIPAVRAQPDTSRRLCGQSRGNSSITMKTTLLLPLSLGLLLVACNRTETSKTTAANEPAPLSAEPAADRARAQNNDASKVASTPAPAPAPGNEVAASAAKAGDPALTLQPLPPAADSALSPSATTAPTPAVASTAARNQEAIATRISEWRLRGDEIKSEFDSSGRVVRSKAPGAGEPTGPMDSVLVGSVKEKIAGDSELSSQKIQVEADDGIVTLKGTASSLDQIGKAVAVSLDTGGVKQVVSTIKLESKQ